MNRNNKLLLLSMGIGAVVGAISMMVWSVAAQKPIRAAAPIAKQSAGYTLETFKMDAPQDGIAATNSGDKPIPPYPSGIGVLTEDKISQGFILLTKLRNERGEIIGFTSEQEVVAAESNVMQGRLMTTTTWTLTIPGRGTIFLSEDENQSEFARKAAIPAIAFDKPWDEPWTFVTTVGPESDGRGTIVGGTDEFAGITGTFVEVTHLRRFSKQEFVGTIELQLAYKKADRGPVADLRY